MLDPVVPDNLLDHFCKQADVLSTVWLMRALSGSTQGDHVEQF